MTRLYAEMEKRMEVGPLPDFTVSRIVSLDFIETIHATIATVEYAKWRQSFIPHTRIPPFQSHNILNLVRV